MITQPGSTISEHGAVIEQVGYCWWGWWKKPYEVVPHGVLAAAADRRPTIYLLDSGAVDGPFVVHRAQLDDLAVAPTTMDIPSPDPAATPPYYNGSRYAVWFKLTEIARAPERDVNAVVVVDLPTWPEVAVPGSAEWRGKRFTSQVELRQLDVTLWDVEILRV